MREQDLFFLALVMGFALLAALAFVRPKMRRPASAPRLRCNSQEPADNQSHWPHDRGHLLRMRAPCFNAAIRIGPTEAPCSRLFRQSFQLTAGRIDVQGTLQDTLGRRHRAQPHRPREMLGWPLTRAGVVIWSRQLQAVPKKHPQRPPR